MRQIVIFTMMLVCTFAVPSFAEVVVVQPGDRVVVAPKPLPVPKVYQSRIQIALLLDTSNSMDGLINQAKAQLWNIVNELSAARCHGEQPKLQVALYEYGNSRLSSGEGYIRQVLPFTNDLDKLSEELFKLTTNGGDEYCGMVIQDALNGLQWSSNEADLKTIYIAGNEPFSQGPVAYQVAAQAAMSKNILVNPIFCGPRKTGIATNWEAGATLTGGCYLSIDQNRRTVYIQAPQDDAISKLNIELNRTYIHYGREGAKGLERQRVQDSRAMGLASAVASQRALAKSSKNYDNSAWDLVDAIANKKVKVSELKESDLPESLVGKDEKQIEKEVQASATKRKEIQDQIQQLGKERTQWLANEQKQTGTNENTLEAAILKSIRQQAMDKKFTFEK